MLSARILIILATCPSFSLLPAARATSIGHSPESVTVPHSLPWVPVPQSRHSQAICDAASNPPASINETAVNLCVCDPKGSLSRALRWTWLHVTNLFDSLPDDWLSWQKPRTQDPTEKLRRRADNPCWYLTVLQDEKLTASFWCRMYPARVIITRCHHALPSARVIITRCHHALQSRVIITRCHHALQHALCKGEPRLTCTRVVSGRATCAENS